MLNTATVLTFAPIGIAERSGADVAQWNHIIVGAAVALIALVRASDPDHRSGMSWMNAVLGLWMIAAPFVLGYSEVSDAQMNSIIVGVIILALGAFSAYETNEAHREEHGQGSVPDTA